jgi:MFS family permease
MFWNGNTAMIGIVGGGRSIGRLLLGGFPERFGGCRVTGASAVVLGVALILMATTRFPLVFIGPAFAFGAGYGGMSSLTTPSAAEIFGSANLGRSVGRMMAAWALGLLIRPWLVALASAHPGGHRDAWLACAAAQCYQRDACLRNPR